jgi:hypothetical protein
VVEAKTKAAIATSRGKARVIRSSGWLRRQRLKLGSADWQQEGSEPRTTMMLLRQPKNQTNWSIVYEPISG